MRDHRRDCRDNGRRSASCASARRNAGEPAQTHGHKTLEIAWTVGPLSSSRASSSWPRARWPRPIRRRTASPTSSSSATSGGGRRDTRRARSRRTRSTFRSASRSLVRVESADVVHDFWVPQLGRKIDAMPGHPTSIWIEADAPGTYPGACAEYCGAQHAWMRILVVAEAPPTSRPGSGTSSRPRAVAEGAASARGARSVPRRHASTATRSATRRTTLARRARSHALRRAHDARRRRRRRTIRRISRDGCATRRRQAGQPHARPQPVRRGGERPHRLPRDVAMSAATTPLDQRRRRRTRRTSAARSRGWRPSTTSGSASSTCVTALFFFAVGGVEALLMRLQLARPNAQARLARGLQPALHDARHDDDLPRRHAGARRLRATTSCR